MGNCVANRPDGDMKNHNSKQMALINNLQSSLNEGNKVCFQGITIKKNMYTGKLQGVPQQWIENISSNHNIDFNKTITSKNLPIELRPEQLPQNITKILTQKQIIYPDSEQSMQKNEKNVLNLIPDPNETYGIRNMTPQLITILQLSKITPIQAKKNSQGLIQMLNNYHRQIIAHKISRHINLISIQQFEQKMLKVQFIEQNPSKFYHFDKQLGKGASCKVYIAFSRAQKDKIYAVRIMKVKEKNKLGKIKRQVAIMQLCQNKNIVDYYFSYYYKDLLFMFIQYMGQGSLTNFILQNYAKIPQPVIAYILKEVLVGLIALHQKRQIHRDLKSDNILIGAEGEIKIADFGFAIQLTKEKDNRVSLVGTPAWMAPQLIQKRNYDEAVDIWSLGMVALQLCLGQPPFLKYQHLKSMYMIVSEQIPKITGFSQQLTNFIDNCLQKNPSKRLTSVDLFHHPFIQSIGTGIKQKYQFWKMLKGDYSNMKI